jgi:hypothetical protein
MPEAPARSSSGVGRSVPWRPQGASAHLPLPAAAPPPQWEIMNAITKPATAAPTREWMPRIWEGIDFFAWMRLLIRNRFAVGLPQLYIAVVITFVSCVNTVLRLIQDAAFGGLVRRTPIRHAPIFIVGHWRTGTTLLHELLILDERHGYPTTYECLAANHFLLTESWLPRLLWWMVPSRRPMDNMAAGWDRPQEDEFALCMIGQPSPYLTIPFPNNGPACPEALDLEGLPPRVRAGWKRAFRRLLQQLTFKSPKRLILKSPTHTCRICVLLEMFPEARFVHIVRDPHVIFPSTVNLWKALYETQGLQTPSFAGLDEHVFATFNHFYKKLDEARPLIRPGHFHELRYEDLMAEPLAEMEKLYTRLGLGGFEAVRPRLEQYFAGQAGYRTNRYEMLPALRAEVERRWGDVIRRYGYDTSV